VETVSCVLCGNHQTRLVGTSTDRRSHAPDTYQIEECLDCGLVYLNPRPHLDEIGAFYPENYGPYQSNKSWRPSEQTAIKKGIIFTAANLYYSTPPIGNISRRFSSPGFSRQIMKLLLLPLKNRLGPLPKFQSEGRILEIGCGTGVYLDIMMDLGWKTFGVEISEKASLIARQEGHDIFNGTLEETEWPNHFFQAACLWHVLEHLHDPIKTLKKMYKIMQPGAELLIEVPNFNGLSSKFFKEDWFGLDVPRHLYFFTADTLRAILEKTGFRIRSIQTHPSRFLIHQSQSSRNPTINRKRKLLEGKYRLEEWYLFYMGQLENRSDLLRIFAARD
jgi:SAM-dependent methyltransferase